MKRIRVHQCAKKDFTWHSLARLMLVMAILFSSCARKPEPYTILRFYGNAEAMNFSRDLYLLIYKSDSIHPGAIIVQKGDLVIINDMGFIYTDPGQDSLYVKSVPGRSLINGKLNSIEISKNDNTEKVLTEILSEDLSGLSMISFNSDVTEENLNLLREIAKIRPDISLGFGDNTENMDAVLKIFDPKLIIINPTSAKILDDIARLSKPEILVIEPSDSLINLALPYIPSLKQLIINSDDKLLHNFLKSNPQIEHLAVMESDCFDFREIEPLSNLKGLIVRQADSITNQDLLREKSSIEMLAVFSELFKYDSTLDNLKNLRWMKFTAQIQQDDFDRFIATHPLLEVVEIIDSKDLNITGPLSSLDKLSGLTLYNHSKDSSSIASLKNLKYLSLPKEDIEDNQVFSELKRAMPNTVIVANEGFCMGSGWLLLLLPLVLMFRIMFLRIPRNPVQKS